MAYADPRDPRGKEAKRRYYEKNKAKYIAQAELRRQKLRDLIRDLKRDRPCADCQRTFHPVCMDFDHRPGETKCFTIAEYAKMVSWARILEEVKKCDLVCANCHRIRTAARLAERAGVV